MCDGLLLSRALQPRDAFPEFIPCCSFMPFPQNRLLETEISIREALLNDFATPTAVNALRNVSFLGISCLAWLKFVFPAAIHVLLPACVPSLSGLSIRFLQLISEGNAYINQTQSGACLNRGQQLLDNICDLTKRYFRIFGFPDNVLSGNVSGQKFLPSVLLPHPSSADLSFPSPLAAPCFNPCSC